MLWALALLLVWVSPGAMPAQAAELPAQYTTDIQLYLLNDTGTTILQPGQTYNLTNYHQSFDIRTHFSIPDNVHIADGDTLTVELPAAFVTSLAPDSNPQSLYHTNGTLMGTWKNILIDGKHHMQITFNDKAGSQTGRTGYVEQRMEFAGGQTGAIEVPVLVSGNPNTIIIVRPPDPGIGADEVITKYGAPETLAGFEDRNVYRWTVRVHGGSAVPVWPAGTELTDTLGEWQTLLFNENGVPHGRIQRVTRNPDTGAYHYETVPMNSPDFTITLLPESGPPYTGFHMVFNVPIPQNVGYQIAMYVEIGVDDLSQISQVTNHAVLKYGTDPGESAQVNAVRRISASGVIDGYERANVVLTKTDLDGHPIANNPATFSMNWVGDNGEVVPLDQETAFAANTPCSTRRRRC